MKKRRVILNNDFYNIFQVMPPVEDQDIYDAVDKVAGTQVDTLTIDVPQDYGSSMLDQDLATLYRHPEGDTCLENLHALIAAGKDPYQMILDRAHEKGLEFFGSLRMNDTHYKDHIFHPFLDQFYYDNLENLVGSGGSRGSAEFDYRKTVVREHYLNTIRETVEKYDMDGFELNFTRNCCFFPEEYSEECAPVMTQFVRDVRAMLDEIGKKRNKQLVLACIVPYSITGCRKRGLDLPVWARLGIIDIVSLLTPFLAEFNHDMHDAKLKLSGVDVYGGCDRNIGFGFDGTGRVVPMQTYRAMAMNYLRQGADGIYLFNVMSWTTNYSKATEAVKRDGGQGETENAPIDYDRGLMDEVGSIETLENLDKLYIMTPSEDPFTPQDMALPATVPAGGETDLRIMIGDDIAKAVAEDKIEKIYLQVMSPDCDDYTNYTIKLNSMDLSRQYAFVPYADTPEDVLLFPEPARRGALPDPKNVRRHSINPAYVHTGTNVIGLKSYKKAFSVTAVELAIVYKKV